MVDPKVIQKQLRDLKFGGSPWNQAELRELPHIIHEGEKISECVNGFYEGGVALLVATEMRLLLIDKKPLNYLNVEDLRFDMINEIDYNHRMMGSSITISTGSKTLKFNSYNQGRLRHLINLVQEHMSNSKRQQAEKADTQQQHLEEINKQLQMYLMAQHQQLQQQISGQSVAPTQQVKPSPQLSDYLFAQRLLEQFKQENPNAVVPDPAPAAVSLVTPIQSQPIESQVLSQLQAQPAPVSAEPVNQAELIADARREVFGNNVNVGESTRPSPAEAQIHLQEPNQGTIFPALAKGLEISPLTIAYSKLPMMLRNRKFGRPSFHAHSQQQVPSPGQSPA